MHLEHQWFASIAAPLSSLACPCDNIEGMPLRRFVFGVLRVQAIDCLLAQVAACVFLKASVMRGAYVWTPTPTFQLQ
jgi:hypothetical protein